MIQAGKNTCEIASAKELTTLRDKRRVKLQPPAVACVADEDERKALVAKGRNAEVDAEVDAEEDAKRSERIWETSHERHDEGRSEKSGNKHGED